MEVLVNQEKGGESGARFDLFVQGQPSGYGRWVCHMSRRQEPTLLCRPCCCNISNPAYRSAKHYNSASFVDVTSQHEQVSDRGEFLSN
jgi:hypothetical protein